MMKARHNPFSSRRIDALSYRFLTGDWNELFLRLRQVCFRAAVTGPYGSGKTTLLEQLAHKLRGEGWKTGLLFINAQRPWLDTKQWREFFQVLRANGIILIDGADLLPAWQRGLVKLLSLKAKGLIIAGHQSLGLPVLTECRTNPHLLDDLLRELTGPLDESLKEKSRALFARHNGNIRDVFRDLYSVYADSREGSMIRKAGSIITGVDTMLRNWGVFFKETR